MPYLHAIVKWLLLVIVLPWTAAAMPSVLQLSWRLPARSRAACSRRTWRSNDVEAAIARPAQPSWRRLRHAADNAAVATARML